MKIIDLLNKIANNEEIPKKIKWNNFVWQQDELEENDYFKTREDGMLDILFGDYLHGTIICSLNDEVEVIEDNKKIEHIGKKYDITDFKREYPKATELLVDLTNKQYEIIDKLNEVLNDKD